MGNRLQGISFNFSDSAWRNTLDIITTNVDNQIGGDGDLSVNSVANVTDKVGRGTRSTDFHTKDWTFDDWQNYIEENVLENSLDSPNLWVIPICSYILAGLVLLNFLMLIMVLTSLGK